MRESSANISYATAVRRVVSEPTTVRVGGVLFLVSMGTLLCGTVLGGSFGSLEGVMVQALAAAVLWTVGASAALLVGLRSVGDERADFFVPALVIVLVATAAASVGGVAVLTACTRLGWDVPIPLPGGDAVLRSGPCIVGAGWIAVFSPLVTVLSGRGWGDVPRVAFPPVSVTVVAWIALFRWASLAFGRWS